MFQKVDNDKFKIMENAAQAIMNKYLAVYTEDVSDSEWTTINIDIKKKFREFDAALSLANGIPVVGARRGMLQLPVQPILIDVEANDSDAGAEKSGRDTQTIKM
jgi:hypothetical protein